MLNENNERELCYVVRIDDIKPIAGRDRVECAVVGGWTVMVRKDQFKPGDLGIYFEIDSKVPDKDPFKFLEAKHFKIKTQKYKTPDGQFWSQGLLMHPSDFNWMYNVAESNKDCIIDDCNSAHYVDDESRFLTNKLEVKYSVEEDNKRKAKSSSDKYKRMASRHGKLFSKFPFRQLMKYQWGRKLLFVFFGKKKDTRSWLDWVVKTDEERIQNCKWMLEDKNPWVATEKIDGTSTTFTMKRTKSNSPFKKDKYDFYVCSRNVVFDTENVDKCFYDSNVYLEMANKYNVKDVLRKLFDVLDCGDYITLQGETYGAGIQKRDYTMTYHDFVGFNLITEKEGRFDSVRAAKLLSDYGIPWVPIINESFIMPDTVEELLNIATDASRIDGGMREGLVFRSSDGKKSFKAVSNEFLLKYHG